MGNQGERICPLCTEEMDLTDQQLKPCKCGYEICVWCWHQIMDMAEKNETEGRCPACRTPYDKEKIVGTAVDCARLVSEVNVEKRAKSQKGKSKSEGRKNLASLRVIQRHIAYVIGMPLTLADEDLLQRREYFGQYGKLVKVSISRTSAGVIQEFLNNTCSVYCTFSNEDEALCCIQSVHGFVLDGKLLKACFGTTKYCHAWLSNVPCSNRDCVYLHEIASQEYSFTKDEAMSDYTRDRLQQNTSSLDPAHRRSGDVLPPPADVCCRTTSSISSGKPLANANVCTNNSAIGARISPPNSSSGRSAALPAGASWGTRASNNQHLTEPPKIKQGVASLSQQSSLHHASGEKLVIEIARNNAGTGGWDDVYDNSCASWMPATSLSSGQPQAKTSTKKIPSSEELAELNSDRVRFASFDTADENANSAMSINENRHQENEESVMRAYGELGNIDELTDSPDVRSDLISVLGPDDQDDLQGIVDDLLSPESERVGNPEVNRVPKFSSASHLSGLPNIHSSPCNSADYTISDDLYGKVIGRNSELMYRPSNYLSRNQEHILNTKYADVNDAGYFNLCPTKDKKSLRGNYEGEMSDGATNRGESGIISNILSTDFDVWNESLTSPQNLVGLLGELDIQRGSPKAPGPRRITSSNQSRFLFAREEGSVSQGSSAFGQSAESMPSNKLSVQRSPIAAPPGFWVPSTQPPPPGFAYHGRTEKLLDSTPGYRMFDNSYWSTGNHIQTPKAGKVISDSYMEFTDPAILAVGRGMLPSGFNSTDVDISQNFAQRYSSNNNASGEARFHQSLFNRSVAPQQNQRYSNPFLGDDYAIPSRVMGQTLSAFSQSNSNGQWNGWSEVQGVKNQNMGEYPRTESLGINNFYDGYEDPKTQMPSSGNLFHGTYGM